MIRPIRLPKPTSMVQRSELWFALNELVDAAIHPDKMQQFVDRLEDFIEAKIKEKQG
jgi:hypothetical protein